MAYKIIGVLGFLGVVACGSSVVAWTIKLGQLQNHIGAVLIIALSLCACVCCIKAVIGRMD